MMEGYRRADPPSVPQLAVPITVPPHCFKASLLSSDDVVCLSIIAFFCILCVGGYTKPRYVIRGGEHIRATRTQKKSVGDVGFFKDGKIVPRLSPVKLLLTSDSATLKFYHQKNNRMGETIHQEAKGTEMCPVKALAHVIHTTLQDGGTIDTLIFL